MKTGLELDALIAEKVMGWHLEPYAKPVEFPLGVLWEPICWYKPDGAKVCRDCEFNPSTSITDAWQVVEKLRNDGHCLIINDTRGQYRARFWKYDGSDHWNIFKWVHEPDQKYTAWEDTAPLAICLAALKAVGVDTEST